LFSQIYANCKQFDEIHMEAHLHHRGKIMLFIMTKLWQSKLSHKNWKWCHTKLKRKNRHFKLKLKLVHKNKKNVT